MDPAVKQGLAEIFSQVAPKVVSLTEFNQEYVRLFKELPFFEKLRLQIPFRIRAAATVILQDKLMSKRDVRKDFKTRMEDKYGEVSVTPLKGCQYVSAGYLVGLTDEVSKKLNGKFSSVAAARLTVEAIKNCADYTSEIKGRYYQIL
jgi:hypothetical protein